MYLFDTMAIEAKIIDEVIEKIEKNIKNKVEENHESKIENKIEAENSCNSTIKLKFKKSNQSTIRITWIPIKKIIHIVVVTLMFMCLYFTIKSGLQTSTTIMSSLEVKFNVVNEIIKKKYHHFQDWLYENAKVEKPLVVSTPSDFINYHEDIEGLANKSKQSNDGNQGIYIHLKNYHLNENFKK